MKIKPTSGKGLPEDTSTRTISYPPKDQSRIGPEYPSQGVEQRAHLGSQSKSPEKEDWGDFPDKASDSEAAYEYAHSQDEVQRTGDSDLGPSRGPSQREIYGF